MKKINNASNNLSVCVAVWGQEFIETFLNYSLSSILSENNIPFIWNSKFPINSLYIMRGYLYVEKDLKELYLDALYNAYWRDNIDLSDEIELTKILKNLNIDNKKFVEGINNQLIKDKLKELTTEAFNKELFGAPTFVANNKIFWGQDRLEYAVDEVSSN